MAIPAGKAIVELELKGEGAMAAKMSSIKSRLIKFGPAVAAVAAAAAAAMAAAAVKAFAEITKASIQAATAFAEIKSKFGVVFGEMSAEMEQFANDYGAAVGRSRKQTLEMLAGMQDLLVPMGVMPGQAAELSKALTMLAVDLASFNNKQDADVMNDLQAALTGSGEVMKKYGVVLTEAAVKQELLNQGLDPKHATDAQKAIARLNIILAGTTAAQGDALRTSDSFANQQKRLKASVDDLMVTFGEQFLPILQRLMAVLLGVVDVIKGPVEDEIENMGDVANDATMTFGDLADTITLLVQGLALAVGPMIAFASHLAGMAANAHKAAAALLGLEAMRLRIQGDKKGSAEMIKLAGKHTGKAMALDQQSDRMFETGLRTTRFGLGLDVGGQSISDAVAARMAESEQRRADILEQQSNLYQPIDIGAADPLGMEANKEKQAEQEQKRLDEMNEAKRKAAEEQAENERKARQKMLDELDSQYDILSNKFEDNFEEMTREPGDMGSLEAISASSTAAYETFKANADRATSIQERQAKLAEEQVKLSKSMEKLLKERQLIVGAL